MQTGVTHTYKYLLDDELIWARFTHHDYFKKHLNFVENTCKRFDIILFILTINICLIFCWHISNIVNNTLRVKFNNKVVLSL